ncbi:MAG TPA: hypothetical protein VHW43_12010 [Puia sp.]|nr:hypothetical protein [Puia sp.]
MMTQHTKLKSVRWTALLAILLFFGCGRGGGTSGHRGASPGGDPAEAGSAGASGSAGSGAGGGTAAAAGGGSAAGSGSAAAVGPVAYDVYMDNSASMDGYLSGAGTDFKNDVHTLLKDLQTQGIADTIDLGFVNDRICPYRYNASAAEVNAFIRSLNHDSLVRNGCGRKDSYMDAMLQQVIGAHRDHVHVLISDFIFSVGRGNSAELLKQQSDNVETVLSDELRKRDFSTIILKFSSDFDGTYYVESKGGGNGSAVSVRGIRRPYYMMIFGSAVRMRRLVEFYKSSHFRTFNGFESVCYFFEPGGGARSGGSSRAAAPAGAGSSSRAGAGSAPAAKLIRKNRVGEFEIAQPATRLVIDKAVADSVDFQFAVAVNLDELKLDDAYLTNPANYELPANYKIAAIIRNTDPTDQPMQGFSHLFLIRTNDLKSVQDVYVRLKSRIPQWVYAGSTMDDANPGDTVQQKQTFGFHYLVEGIARAYADKYKDMDQFALNIQVSEGAAPAGGSGALGASGDDGAGSGSGSASGGSGGGRGGFPWVLVVIGVAVVGVVVWIKNKR